MSEQADLHPGEEMWGSQGHQLITILVCTELSSSRIRVFLLCLEELVSPE